MLSASKNGHASIVSALLDAGAKPTYDNHSSFWEAAQNGHPQVMSIFLRLGVPPAHQAAALRLAALEGHAEAIALLLTTPVSEMPSILSGSCQEALFEAAANGHGAIMELLLNAGVDLYRQGDRALIAAAENGHTEAVEVLLSRGRERDLVFRCRDMALVKAALCGHDEIVALLLEDGADVHVKGPSGAELLADVAKVGYTAVVAELLAVRPKRRAHFDEFINLGLKWAAQNGHGAIVDLLLEAGGDPRLVSR